MLLNRKYRSVEKPTRFKIITEEDYYFRLFTVKIWALTLHELVFI